MKSVRSVLILKAVVISLRVKGWTRKILSKDTTEVLNAGIKIKRALDWTSITMS
jgi:hypothetical protein